MGSRHDQCRAGEATVATVAGRCGCMCSEVENIRNRLMFCIRQRDGTAEDWGKVISLNLLSDCLGHLEERSLTGEENVSAPISSVSCHQ